MDIDMEILLRKNTGLKNIHKGKRCFIIGNGPSIAQQDLLLLKDDVKIATSYFYRHPEVQELQPQYWVVADPQFWTNPDNTLYPLLQNLTDQHINTKVFMPINSAQLMEQVQYGLHVEPHFFNYGEQITFKEIDFSRDIPPLGQNVVCVAIMLALFLGCTEIYLIGCDHDWWEYTKENYLEASSKYKHFYPKPTDVKLKSMSQQLTFEELSKTIENQRNQYEKLKIYGKEKGQYIFNATQGGCLEIFPRVQYQDILLNGRTDKVIYRFDNNEYQSEFIETADKLVQEKKYNCALVLLNNAIMSGITSVSTYKEIHKMKAICFEELGYKYEAILAKNISGQKIDEKQMRYETKVKILWTDLLYFIRMKLRKIKILRKIYSKFK